jgi:VanZ family protein
MILHQKIFRYIFWTGYLTVLITAFIPLGWDFAKIKIGPEAFHIRLDHLLHLAAYLLICMYYLFGLRKGLTLFNKNSLRKFVLLILLLGTITEVVQIWIPSRSFNVFDMAANVAGVVAGVGIVSLMQRRLRDEK